MSFLGQWFSGLPQKWLEGWREIRLDADPSVAPDIVGTMVAMSAVPDGFADIVEAAGVPGSFVGVGLRRVEAVSENVK